jgi:hypothetical protein
MDDDELQAFVEGISTKSWTRILKIVDVAGIKRKEQSISSLSNS